MEHIFKFVNDKKDIIINDNFFIEFSKEGLDKNSFLIELSELLKFPEYFGYNWDALADCLKDLNWISQKGIIIYHNCLPQLTERELTIYLSILNNCSSHWEKYNEHFLKVFFNEKFKNKIIQYIS